MTTTPDPTTELELTEARRCEALMNGDIEVLSALLSDDLMHVHLSCQCDGREKYLAGVRERFRFQSVERGPLNIRIFGDTAIMIGPLVQKTLDLETGTVREISATTTQVWNRQGDSWIQNTCHNALPS